MTKSQIRHSAFAFALAVFALLAGPALAHDVNIDYVKYTNKGAYTAWLTIVWINSDGTKDARTVGPERLAANESHSVDLDRLGEGVLGTTLDDGEELWLSVQINAGEKKKCRKDSHRFLFKEDSDQQVSYQTGGTTTLNNGCQIDEIKKY
jgi:hypothetical protein